MSALSNLRAAAHPVTTTLPTRRTALRQRWMIDAAAAGCRRLSDYNIDMRAKLTSRMARRLALTLAHHYSYDSTPRPRSETPTSASRRD
jgi:hypothetical protein